MKFLVVFTTKAWPRPPGKALIVPDKQIGDNKFTKILNSWPDPVEKITK